MGLFSKTLEDAKAALRKKDLRAAADILKAHLAKEHQLYSTTNMLVRELMAFQKEIISAHNLASSGIATGAASAIDRAEDALKAVRLYIRFIKPMAKEEQ